MGRVPLQPDEKFCWAYMVGYRGRAGSYVLHSVWHGGKTTGKRRVGFRLYQKLPEGGHTLIGWYDRERDATAVYRAAKAAVRAAEREAAS